jgi:hypothetical protein
MKKTFSIVYTALVVVVLLCVIAFFGWKTYDSRTERLAAFTERTDEYTRRLAESLAVNRNVDIEVAEVEKLMTEDLTLVAVQVFSHDDGLRLSVVKPVAGELARTPIAGSGKFDGPVARIRYHAVSRPMRVTDMQGMEATYVSALLSGAEIRNYLLIILITVVGLFAITLVLILVKPREAVLSGDEEGVDDEEVSDFGSEEDFSVPDDSFGTGVAAEDDIDFSDFGGEDRLDENDLFGSGPDIDDTHPFDEDFNLPESEDFPESENIEGTSVSGAMVSRLDLELERAASFNQDLSVILFSNTEKTADRIREYHTFKDLLFTFGDGGIGVIELNRDLDTTLSRTEELVIECIEKTGGRTLRAGIASRNGRLISAKRLLGEAEKALAKTDAEKNIVAFRSDPEKYREFLRSQSD